MNKMSRHSTLGKLRTAICGTFAAMSIAGTVIAQPTPATRPTERPGPRDGSVQPGPARQPRVRLPQTWQEATAAEQEAVKTFTRESMPDLAKRWEATTFGTPARRRIQALALRRWRDVSRIREEFPDDPTLVESLLAQYKSEDEIFGLVEQFLAAAPADRPTARAKIVEKLGEIIGNMFRERERRLIALEEQVKSERARLTEDMQRQEATVEQRIKQLVREVEQMNAGDDKKTDAPDADLPTAGPRTSSPPK